MEYMNQYLEKQAWFEACRDDNKLDVMQELLRRGFDPDTRSYYRKSGLREAAEAAKSGRTTRKVSALLLDALKTHYADDPQALLKAITDGNPKEKYPGDYSDIVKQMDDVRLYARSQQRKSKHGNGTDAQPTEPVIVPVKEASSPSPGPIQTVAAAPSPVRLDRTITAAKLKQLNSSGQSNLTTLATQGKLKDIFTPEIWMGRRDEMEKVWEQVPPALRTQVNIEAVRGSLSQGSMRAKFGVGDKSWENGI